MESPSRQSKELNVYYKSRLLDTRYKPGLLVCLGIVVALKALSDLTYEHEAQLFNYMRIARQPVGYLINSGHKDELEWKHFIPSDFHEKKEH